MPTELQATSAAPVESSATVVATVPQATSAAPSLASDPLEAGHDDACILGKANLLSLSPDLLASDSGIDFRLIEATLR